MTERESGVLKQLTREIRNAVGFERTPIQVLNALVASGVKRGQIVRVAKKMIDDPDMVLSFCRRPEIKMEDQDDIPSSFALGMG